MDHPFPHDSALAVPAIGAAAADVPRVPGGLPLLGHLREIIKRPIDLAHYAFKTCGEIAEIRLPMKRLFLFTGPEAHDFVLNSPDDTLSMSEFFKFILPAFYGPTFEHDAKLDFPYGFVRYYAPFLAEGRPKRHAETMQREIVSTLEGVEGEVDLYELGKRILLKTAGRCILGDGVDAAQFAEFERFYMNMYGAMSFGAIASANLGLPFATKAEKARRRLQEIMAAGISARRRAEAPDDSALEVFKNAMHPSGRPLADNEATGMILQLLFAAHTPASVAFVWTGVELARNPAWAAEVRAQLAEKAAPPAASAQAYAHSLTFLDWTVQETLRLHSPAAFHARAVLKDTEYKGHRIPKGSIALISPDVAHRLPRFFPEPDRFDPRRFAPERTERKGHPMALMTFGAGPRRCIGSSFAMLQLVLAWAEVLKRFDFEVLDDVKPKCSGLLMTPSRCRARFTRRA